MARKPVGALLLALLACVFALGAMLMSVAVAGTVDDSRSEQFAYWADALLALGVLFLGASAVSMYLRLSEMVDDQAG